MYNYGRELHLAREADAVRPMRFIGDFLLFLRRQLNDPGQTLDGTEHSGTDQDQEPALTLKRYMTNSVKTGNLDGPDLRPGARAGINVMEENDWRE
ncbi:hypothetical protein CDD82_2734 [Ophiocordyceps australis]|uniref:Uncharacterized protein n=1 Tax=Ophiocordyceps australis TaxID=1399860 RepID=A0A2C5XUK0_9HYPO|nr:hypothetical protein CDD82_2734 [Ophiocordyceps australis]